MIWDRFPKFVLGFIAASLIFSFVLPIDLVSTLKSPLKNIQNLLVRVGLYLHWIGNPVCRLV
jgi:uncharacterized membrane protein YadS